jgi:GRAB domain
VTNVLMAFFSTQRADPKRFEMLQLLASVLSWTDEERERVGLQRSLGNASTASRPRAASRAKGKEDASEDGLENEVGFFFNPRPADERGKLCVPRG